MKDLVVCIKKFTNPLAVKSPIVGEIYEIDGFFDDKYIHLKGFDQIGYSDKVNGNVRIAFDKSYFRPVDDTFGEVVCETIEQQLELEKVLN